MIFESSFFSAQGCALQKAVSSSFAQCAFDPGADAAVSPSALPDFEATLAKSRFDKWTVYNRMGHDNGHGRVESVCIDGVVTSIEAIVDRRYRMVLFDACGGVFDEQIAQSLDQLFVFTANLRHLKYPVNADHPTFRGY